MRIKVDPEVRKRFLKQCCKNATRCFQSPYFYVSKDNTIGLCKKFEKKRYTEIGTLKFNVAFRKLDIRILENFLVSGFHIGRAMRVFRRRRIVTLGIYNFRKGTVLAVREGDQYILVAPFSFTSPLRKDNVKRLSELVVEVPESYNVLDVMSRLEKKDEE